MRMHEQHTQHGKDRYMLIDGELTQLAEKHSSILRSEINGYRSWYGGIGYDAFAQRIVTGDESLVAQSDKFLAQIEDQVPVSRGWRNVDDVVGAVPNVPAFLAGHPQHMRRRERTMRDNAPLAIYMDLTSSGGIDACDVQRRGITLLALTRLLVEHRPVELWVGASLGSYRLSGTVAWRIDTMPLDLARAAFHIGHPSMARGFGYKLCQKELGTGGHWPFNSYSTHCDSAKERLTRVFEGQELMYIPPIFLGDELTRDPVGWVKRVMSEYVKQED